MNKKENMVEKGSEAYYQRQVSMGRSTLLLVVALTVLNLGLVFAGANTYLLFSASGPYYLTVMARGFDLAAYGAVNQSYTWAALAASALVLGLYLLCWLWSKKQHNWLVAGLVLFILDTICLVLLCRFVFGDYLGSMMDFLMHGWALYELVVATRAARRLHDGAYTI